MTAARLDEVGYWSEIKLEIVKKYAQAYSTILSAQKNPSFTHVYIDAFAGAGVHISRETGEEIPGSPLNALNARPPFKEYHLIDLSGDKIELLQQVTSEFPNVATYPGDCNRILLDKVFPTVRWEDYRRALCLLDPYGLHLNWEVVYTAGKMKSIEIFLNFPVMDMNMNVLWRHPDKVDPKQAARMDAFWGDASWRDVAYKEEQTLFGPAPAKAGTEAVVKAYQARLREVAGFKYIPDPMPMRNSKGAVVYYLFFASPKPVAEEIVQSIFDKYRNKGAA